MSNVSSSLERMVNENGPQSDELLLALIRTLEDQNAIQDDAIGGELGLIAGELAQINRNLVALSESIARLTSRL